jgi:hypothetical protein
MKLRRREAKEAQIPSRRLQRCRLQRLEDPIERAHSLLQEAKRPARPLGEARGTCSANAAHGSQQCCNAAAPAAQLSVGSEASARSSGMR